MLLLEIVLIGFVGLAPGLETATIGVAILVTGLSVWVPTTFIRVRALTRPAPPTRWQRLEVLLLVEFATVPPILAGGSLIAGAGGGFYWLVVGSIFAIVAGVLDGWVLLVEILRWAPPTWDRPSPSHCVRLDDRSSYIALTSPRRRPYAATPS